MRGGASGFILKDAAPSELLHATRVVAAGASLLSPSVTRRVIEQFARHDALGQPHPDPGGSRPVTIWSDLVTGWSGLWSGMRYAVTGATGFVGGRLTRMLVDSGHLVTALVRTPGKAQALTALGADLVPGDLGDRASLDRLLDGADGLFHVAGWYKVGSRDRSDGYRINVEGTRSILTAAQAAGTSRVVYTSTLAINSDTRGVVHDESYEFTGMHLSTYDATKAEAQRIADRFAADGLPLVTVMPGLVYGPADTSQTGHLIRNVVAGKPVAVPSGNRLCWGYVDDIVQGHILAMEKATVGQRYMLAGPIHTLADALRTAARIAGTREPLVVPATVIGGLAVVSAWLERVVLLPPTVSSEALRAATADYLGSPHKAQRELGWSARSLEQGMQETVRSLRP